MRLLPTRVIRRAVRAWVEEHITPNIAEWEDVGECPAWAYAQAAKDGLLVPAACGAKIDKRYRDRSDRRGVISGIKPDDWDEVHDLILVEELRRAGGAGPIGFPMLKDWASQELKDRVVPSILRGDDRICLAITEPEAGTENKCVAVRQGDHYVVNGMKKWITNDIHSTYFATAVRTAGKPGDQYGISILLIPRGKGFSTRPLKIMGTNSAGTSYLSFDDVIVPAPNIIGPGHDGLNIVFTNFNHERMMCAYSAIALTRTVINDTIAYTSNRIVDGQPLIKKGVVLHQLAKMAILCETQQQHRWIESVIYQLDHLSKEEGNRLLGGVTALIKANCSLVLEPCASQAVQLVGGIGYTKGGKGERIGRIFREIREGS